ncbi:early endosome antigen 1-like isoform X3 [Halichondria panicea]|uniref:early endosome antigen 1-like isoform X3 n=1 Tax=Halichondria panicea TaxID=6063 RepID=UPI00312B8C16
MQRPFCLPLLISEMSEVELKSRVVQLETELEQERAKSKQLQNEKVTELEAIQEAARRHIEELKRSFEDEKQDQSAREKKGRSSVTAKFKQELRQQVEQELITSYTIERKKITQDFDSQFKSAAEEISRLKATLKNKDTLLQEKEKELRTSVERTGRSERKASKQHIDEVENHRRQMQSKEKELSQLAEKLSRTMADKDKLVEDMKRLKEPDMWGHRSTTPTSPSLSPSASVEELSAVSKQVSRRERDMVIRNSELSFRVRTLEGYVSDFRGENADLKQKLSESRSQLTPLKEHNNRLNVRINDLNVSMRSREKKVISLSQEIVELKSAKQQLEEDLTRQRKSLQQQLTRCTTFRNEVQKLNGKNQSLTDTNTRLLLAVDRLESDNSGLEQQMRSFMLASPTPLSPPPSTLDDDETCSVSSGSSSMHILEDRISQMEFDKDETEIQLEEFRDKYEGMKLEYSSLRSKYKALRTTYETAQQKMRELQASYREELSRTERFEKERLHLEGELDMLRRASQDESLYDQDRQVVTMESLQLKVDELQAQVDELEEFVCDQDIIWLKQEEAWAAEKETHVSTLEKLQEAHRILTEEKERLAATLDHLQEAFAKEKDTLISTIEQLKQVSHKDNTSELEEMNSQLTKQLNEVLRKQVSMEDENNQLSEMLAARTRDLTNHEDNETRFSEDLITATDKITSQEHNIAQLRGELENAGRTNLKLEKDFDKVLQDRDTEYSILAERFAQLQENVMKAPSSSELVSVSPIEPKVEGNTYIEEKQKPFTASYSLETADESTSTSSLPQLAELSQQYREQLKQKEEDNEALHDSLSLARTNKAQMKALLEDLQTTLHTQSEDYLSHIGDKDQQISELTEQLSQASSKLTRLRRAVPVGINHQMASELGHKVKAALKTLSAKARSSPTRNSNVMPYLRSLEEATNELLHTLFPGTFDAELTPVNSETTLISEYSTTSELSSMSDQDLVEMSTTTPVVHTPTHLPHSQSSPLSQEEVDYPLPRGIPQTFPIKSRETSPSTRTQAWRESSFPFHPVEDLLNGEPSMKKKEGASNGLQEARVFVAVLDYDPKSMCVTGQPGDELSFNTGAVLAVNGNMDGEGYYTATFEGITGRVPANFIQEVDVSDPAMKNRLFNQTLGSPLPTDSYKVPSRHTLSTALTETSLLESFASSHLKTPAGATGCPNPPAHFKVDKALGNSVLLVTWQPPKMDSSDGNYSNGCFVTGYQLYVNGETKNLISGAMHTKATFVELNLLQPLTLGISTCAVNGKSSKVITIHYQPRPLSAVTSPSPEPEQYRTFIALYDYDPVKSSPCDHPEFELALCEGDLLMVYGQEMEDGFMVGELNGQRGLVPASFINEVKKPHIKQSSQMGSSVTESVRSQSASPSIPKLPGTTTLMIASFDYDPERDSPNPNSEMELGFKRGDEITVFGKIHGDGYYSGQLGDKFGLVPSNFLTRKQPSHPLSESYECTTTSRQQDAMCTIDKKVSEEGVQKSNGLSSSEQPVQTPKQNEVKTEASKSPKTKSLPKGKSRRTGSPSDPKKKRSFRWQKS